jgi:hypothetical protein
VELKITPGDTNIVCPACLDKALEVRTRIAEAPPMESKEDGTTWANYKAIGQVYQHEDGRICDVSHYKFQKLSKPVYLRLGDPTRDPRV